jgi:hypothetical protein
MRFACGQRLLIPKVGWVKTVFDRPLDGLVEDLFQLPDGVGGAALADQRVAMPRLWSGP